VADHFNGKTHPELGIRGGLREVHKQLVKPYSDRKIINQSHDSAILEVPKGDAQEMLEPIMKLMLRPLVINNEEFTIPVDLEWGDRWSEMKKPREVYIVDNWNLQLRSSHWLQTSNQDRIKWLLELAR
jgi:hypothetical protein